MYLVVRTFVYCDGNAFSLVSKVLLIMYTQHSILNCYCNVDIVNDHPWEPPGCLERWPAFASDPEMFWDKFGTFPPDLYLVQYVVRWPLTHRQVPLYHYGSLLFFQVPFCTGPECEDYSDSGDETAGDDIPEGAAGAWVQTSKMWRTRDQLKVHFLNPEALEGWKIGNAPMNVDNILAWAAEWSSALAPEIPTFVRKDTARNSDVRVSFKCEPLL